MQRIDAVAIEQLGIPRLLLMEHAGLCLARIVQAMTPASVRPILICCGAGFNGGDGLAAARHLQAWGSTVRIVLAGAQARLRGEPAVFAGILERLGVPFAEWNGPQNARGVAQWERWLNGSGLIVDALLGIGVREAVREPIASLIERINDSGKPIVAADVPSGLDADTGQVLGCAVHASVTVTFGRPKRGCFIRSGPAHTGALVVDPISLPAALLNAADRLQ